MLAGTVIAALGSTACGDTVVGKRSDANSGGTGGAWNGEVTVSGCPDEPTAAVAPNGYYVNGNTICTSDGKPHLLHGINRPSLVVESR